MIKTNNDIIKYKNEEKEKLNERINALNNDLEKQKIKLDKINSTLNEYKSQNENYINKLNNTELNYMEKYEDLESRYKKLKSQYDVYFNMELKKRKLELDYKNDNLCRDETDKVNLSLQDKIVKNVFLKEIVDEIKRQINEIEAVNKRSEEEEQMLKFLGKAFYNKVKQRRALKETAKENNENKSKSKSKSKTYLKTEKSGNIRDNIRKSKTIKKRIGLNLLVSNSQYYFKNKNKNNALNSYFNTSNNVNIYGNNLKDTCFTSYKNTKNKVNSTTTGSS
jgi:DNA repair exonuclease SbcCD ATPase subunit